MTLRSADDNCPSCGELLDTGGGCLTCSFNKSSKLPYSGTGVVWSG